MLTRFLVSALLSGLAAAQPASPLWRTRQAVLGTEVSADVQAMAEQGPRLSDQILHGLASVKLFAYLQSGDAFHAVQIFPDGNARVFAVPGLQRVAWEAETRLGPLHVRTALHYDTGTTHVEGSVLILNSESVAPVGDVRTDWLGLGVGDGLGVFHPRAAVPFGLEPLYLPGDPNVSTWKLSYTSHLAGACMVPVPFVIGFGTDAENLRAYSEPNHIRRQGEFLIPAPQFGPAQADQRRAQALQRWRSFQFDRGAKSDPGYLFGETKFTGSAGAQGRLGKHPCLDVMATSIASGYESDRLRAVTMWTEGRRKFWLDWPHGDNEAYNFYGLHWTSRWKAGYTRNPDGSWAPPFGDDHGVSGHNLEHLRSRLPELAYVTGDPQLMWMTSRFGWMILSTITADGIQGGGFFGGGFSTLRGILRPLAELMECVVALRTYGDLYAADIAAFEGRIAAKVAWLVEKHPRFAKVPDRPDEQIPGHEGQPVSEVWQAGIGGDYLWSWWLLTGDQNAFTLAQTLQQMHLEAWRGTTSATVEMPKQVLASDWSIGRGYGRRHDFLVGWNYSLLAIPGIPGIDQARREVLRQAILMEYPGAPWTTWGCGSWVGFEPAKVAGVGPR